MGTARARAHCGYDALGRRSSKCCMAHDGITNADEAHSSWDGTLAEQTDSIIKATLTWEYDGHRSLTLRSGIVVWLVRAGTVTKRVGTCPGVRDAPSPKGAPGPVFPGRRGAVDSRSLEAGNST